VPKLAHAPAARSGHRLAQCHAERIAEAHELKLEVLPWTVNDSADMARLIDAGVDGLITDYPDRLREVMRVEGLPLP
jgi:glycerophosphoryl diester phosphodiesterase